MKKVCVWRFQQEPVPVAVAVIVYLGVAVRVGFVGVVGGINFLQLAILSSVETIHFFFIKFTERMPLFDVR